MKLILTLLPFLGALALAQDLTSGKCQCPQVKCPGDDAVALCNCLNSAETLCKKRCPDYIPKYKPCPVKPSVKPTPTPTPTPPKCECEQVFCTQQWPDSCYCANAAKKRCYEKCGGIKPAEQVCESNDVKAREPEPVSEPVPAKVCECDQIMCAQLWPESCYCANAAAESCYKKCGGKKPVPQTCPQPVTKTLTTKKTPTPTKTTATPKPTGTHAVCGGGRANQNLNCAEGYVCITDPFSPGCGPPCDGLGICVKDKLCGGFAGFKCSEAGQVCVDDPRDSCDPKNGGADCGGLCVWPH